VDPKWSHFQVRYVKGPGVIELLTAHGTVCSVPSGEIQGGVRCDGKDEPWRALHETRELLAIYGDEGLFGDDGTVQFRCSSNKILHTPGAAQGAQVAADGAIGQWKSGNERKVLTFVKVSLDSEPDAEPLAHDLPKASLVGSATLHRHIEDHIEALRLREEHMKQQLDCWAVAKVVRLEVQVADLARMLSHARTILFRALATYRHDDWALPALCDPILAMLESAAGQEFLRDPCTESSLKPYLAGFVRHETRRHGYGRRLQWDPPKSELCLSYRLEGREVSSPKRGFHAAMGMPCVSWADQGVLRWEVEIVRSSEMDIYVGVALESCEAAKMVDVMERRFFAALALPVLVVVIMSLIVACSSGEKTHTFSREELDRAMRTQGRPSRLWHGSTGAETARPTGISNLVGSHTSVPRRLRRRPRLMQTRWCSRLRRMGTSYALRKPRRPLSRPGLVQGPRMAI